MILCCACSLLHFIFNFFGLITVVIIFFSIWCACAFRMRFSLLSSWMVVACPFASQPTKRYVIYILNDISSTRKNKTVRECGERVFSRDFRSFQKRNILSLACAYAFLLQKKRTAAGIKRQTNVFVHSKLSQCAKMSREHGTPKKDI